MNRSAKVAATLLAVLVLGSGGLWAASVALAPQPTHPASARSVATPPANDAELERLQSRVDELERRLAHRQRRVTLPAPAPEADPAKDETEDAAGAASAGVARPPAATLALGLTSVDAGDYAALVTIALEGLGDQSARAEPPQPVEPVEPVDLATLTDDELLAHANDVSDSKKPGALAASLAAWHELVDRDPGAELLDQALFGLGIAQRNGRSHEAEQETFQRLIEFSGPNTERVSQARYQLAWARYYAKDYDGALAEMDAVVDALGDGSDRARHALLNGSAFASAGDDPGRARAMLERLQRAVEGESDARTLSRWFEKEARRRLEQLE